MPAHLRCLWLGPALDCTGLNDVDTGGFSQAIGSPFSSGATVTFDFFCDVINFKLAVPVLLINSCDAYRVT